jgi:hypothetical protein
MQGKRREMAARKGFEAWRRRFSESFDENTCLHNLSDSTLAVLIQGGEEGSMPLYELILGVKGMGMGPRFYFMENMDKMAIMDISLFLLDQFRFEAMRRLGWVEDCPSRSIPLVDLVDEFSTRFLELHHQSPGLAPSHPRFPEYQAAFAGDRTSFVRRLIPEMLEVFGKEHGGAGKP